MQLRADFANFYQSDQSPGGIPVIDWERSSQQRIEVFESLQQEIEKGHVGFARLPQPNPLELDTLINKAEKIRKQFRHLVVVGIGGSLLGAKMLYHTLGRGSECSVHFIGNTTDPSQLLTLLSELDLSDCVFNVVSKSGSTLETVALFEILMDLCRQKFGNDFALRFICTTEDNNQYLYRVAMENNMTVFSADPEVGGRYSVLSKVGLFPAAYAGIDVRELLSGADAMQKELQQHGAGNGSLEYAWLQYHAAITQSRWNNVFMAYTPRLDDFGMWLRQLWAESLGKTRETGEGTQRVGMTPIIGEGPEDQHSQLQLFNQGPTDKTITFLSLKETEGDMMVPEVHDPEFRYLGGKTLGQILQAELTATREDVTEHNQLNALIELTELSARSIGELIYFFEMATVYTARLLDVDPFNQPGVESSKHKIKHLLGGA